MKPFLSVPFLPEELYVDFLVQCAADLDNLHIDLFAGQSLDNLESRDFIESSRQALQSLERLPGPRKYLLLDNRFHDPKLLTDSRIIRALVAVLEQGLERGLLDGIVYADYFLLQHLADYAPELAARLEAVPSINTLMDSSDKIESQQSYIQTIGFRQPGKITLDRELNRNLDDLATLTLQLHDRFPDLKVELLANEGCLCHCPYKLSHDAYKAHALQQSCSAGTEDALRNHNVGCMRFLDEYPHRMLQSPFIRPEDVDSYLYHADVIKLYGRHIGTDFLMRVIDAYRKRSYEGNLLDLLEGMFWMTEYFFIDNRQLSFDFANILSQCDQQCDSCGFCNELFHSIARRRAGENKASRYMCGISKLIAS